MTVLIDTNILIDAIQSRVPFDADALRLFTLAEHGTLDGHVSAISFNNLFYVLEKQIGLGPAMDAVKLVRKVFKFVPFDDLLLDHAISLTTTDLEDAIQAAAAFRVNADYVVTRDAKGFVPFGLPAVTAKELLALHVP